MQISFSNTLQRKKDNRSTENFTIWAIFRLTKVAGSHTFQIPSDAAANNRVQQQHRPHRSHGEVVVRVNGRRHGRPRDSRAFALEHADEFAAESHASVDGKTEDDFVGECQRVVIESGEEIRNERDEEDDTAGRGSGVGFAEYRRDHEAGKWAD